MSNERLEYKASPTLRLFHADDSTVKVIEGPPGSGKSVANVMELWFEAVRMMPTPKGERLFRAAIIRDTYPNLEMTVLKTVQAWIPPLRGNIRMKAPYEGGFTLALPDKTILKFEVLLISASEPADVGKLDSFEPTMVYFNELGSIHPIIFGRGVERAGRYPERKLWPEGIYTPRKRRVIADMNTPKESSWVVSYFANNPDNAKLFRQPPALLEQTDLKTNKVHYIINPLAENLASLDNGQKYIDDLKTQQALGNYDEIETRLLGRYGKGISGQAIITTFNRNTHISKEKLEPRKRTPVVIGFDTSGLHACAIIAQWVKHSKGHFEWQVQESLYADNVGFEDLLENGLRPLLDELYPECHVMAICDPADARDSRTKTSPIMMLKEVGITAVPAFSNKFRIRKEALNSLFYKDDFIRIDYRQKVLLDALDGGYQYRKISLRTGSGDTRYSSEPDKNSIYSHYGDACSYFALHVLNQVVDNSVMESIKKTWQQNSVKKQLLG